MVNRNYSLATLIVVVLVVAVIASVITASITGNVIRVDTSRRGPQVYTKQEIDKILNGIDKKIVVERNENIPNVILTLLNKCEVVKSEQTLEEGGVKSCNAICEEYSSKSLCVESYGGSLSSCDNGEWVLDNDKFCKCCNLPNYQK